MAAATRFDAASMAILLFAVTGAAGALIGIISALTMVLSKLNTINYGAIAYIITLTGVVIALIFAFSSFLDTASRTGFQVSEIAGILGTLTGAIIAVIATIVGATVVLAGLSVTAAAAAPVVLLMLGLGAAALLVGAGFMMAGLGVKMASEGIALLVGHTADLASLVPIVFTFGVAIGGLAISIGLLGAAGFAAFAGLGALALAIFGLAAAFSALVIPLGVIRGLGGEGAVVETIKKIPQLETGGMITDPGLAYVHPEEMVTPAKAKPLKGGGTAGYTPKEAPPTITVNLTGANSIEEIVRRTVEASVSQITVIQDKKYRTKEF